MHSAVSRAGAFSIVVLLHVAVIAASWQRLSIQRKNQHFLTWVDIEPRADVPPPEPERAPPVFERDIRMPARRDPAVDPVSPAISAAPTDWRMSGETAATAAVAAILSREGHRALGPNERPRPESSTPESIFERPRRKAGDIDVDPAQGRTLIWHNEHCYTELKFPTIKESNAPVGMPSPPKCMAPIGKRQPRGDLFEEMKKR